MQFQFIYSLSQSCGWYSFLLIHKHTIPDGLQNLSCDFIHTRAGIKCVTPPQVNQMGQLTRTVWEAILHSGGTTLGTSKSLKFKILRSNQAVAGVGKQPYNLVWEMGTNDVLNSLNSLLQNSALDCEHPLPICDVLIPVRIISITLL